MNNKTYHAIINIRRNDMGGHNLPDSVKDSDLPGNRPGDVAEEKYQEWLDAKGLNGKRQVETLVESFCLDGLFSDIKTREKRHIAGWMLALLDAEASMPTGLADFDAYCRKIYEEG